MIIKTLDSGIEVTEAAAAMASRILVSPIFSQSAHAEILMLSGEGSDEEYM
jgi:hypothetical protein